MLMGHPSQRITWGRDNGPQGCCEGLTPVQVPMVVQARVAYDAEGQEALADTLEAVQDIAPARPRACHRVPVRTCPVRVPTSLLARTMVDRTMIIVDLGAMGDVLCIRAELSPAFPLGNHERFARRGASMLSDFQRDVRGWRVLVCLVAALPHAQQGWTARLGGSATAQRPPSWSGGAVAAFACTGQPWTARTLGALVSCSLVRQWAGRIPMGRCVEAPIQQRETLRRCPLLARSGRGHYGGVQLPWPHADPQQPCEGPPLPCLEDRPGPVRAHGTRLAPARRAGHPVEALESVVAPFARLARIAATAWTRDAIGPAPLSQVISGLQVLLQVWYEVLHRVAPTRCEQPHSPATAWVKL